MSYPKMAPPTQARHADVPRHAALVLRRPLLLHTQRSHAASRHPCSSLSEKRASRFTATPGPTALYLALGALLPCSLSGGLDLAAAATGLSPDPEMKKAKRRRREEDPLGGSRPQVGRWAVWGLPT
jgi:hypothetical protein